MGSERHAKTKGKREEGIGRVLPLYKRGWQIHLTKSENVFIARDGKGGERERQLVGRGSMGPLEDYCHLEST